MFFCFFLFYYMFCLKYYELNIVALCMAYIWMMTNIKYIHYDHIYGKKWTSLSTQKNDMGSSRSRFDMLMLMLNNTYACEVLFHLLRALAQLNGLEFWMDVVKGNQVSLMWVTLDNAMPLIMGNNAVRNGWAEAVTKQRSKCVHQRNGIF